MSETISDRTNIKLPVGVWLAVIATAAVAGGAWWSIKQDVARHGAEILDIHREQQTQREVLIRIDEGVKQLKRERRI